MQKIGVLGCGRVSGRYEEVFRDELRDCAVVAVCDSVREKADRLAKALKTESVYTYEDLLAKDVGVVVILTESGKHFDHARTALEAGKHVIVEKPAALLPDQIVANEKLAAEKSLMFSVVHQNRFNPAMTVLKKTFDQGRFKKVVLATIRLRWCRYQEYYEDGWHGTWKMDGGVISQQAIHHLDALQWVCGPIERVTAVQTNALNDLEAEDTTAALAVFRNGALGVIETTTAARPDDFEASISIVGEGGIIVIGGIALNNIESWQFVQPEPEDEYIPEKFSQDVPTGYGLSHGPLIQENVDRLNAGRLDPPITGTDASQCVRLVHALYRSAETGGWVSLDGNPVSERLGR
jgi:predicted dehydrogenase